MTPDSIETLNEVLVLLRSSFPQYLLHARPYVPSHAEEVRETLSDIVSDQNSLADRIAGMVFESGSLPAGGAFPMEFTDAHDLGIRYLVRRAIDDQQTDIAALAQRADHLRLAPAARSAVEEALGMSRGHLEALEELLVKLDASDQPTARGAQLGPSPH